MSDETKDPGGTLSRRLVLRATVVTLGAAGATGPEARRALATVKISKAAVAYQDHPQGDKRCEKCAQFQMPSTCKLVDGPISPQGFCRIFSPLRQATLPARTVLTG